MSYELTAAPSLSEEEIKDLSGSSFEMTPEGKYKMALASIKGKVSSTGKKGLELFFKHTEAKGYKGVTLRLWETDTNAMGITSPSAIVAMAEALGYSGAQKALRLGVDANTPDGEYNVAGALFNVDGESVSEALIGTEFVAGVKHSTYNDKTRAEVSYLSNKIEDASSEESSF